LEHSSKSNLGLVENESHGGCSFPYASEQWFSLAMGILGRDRVVEDHGEYAKVASGGALVASDKTKEIPSARTLALRWAKEGYAAVLLPSRGLMYRTKSACRARDLIATLDPQSGYVLNKPSGGWDETPLWVFASAGVLLLFVAPMIYKRMKR